MGELKTTVLKSRAPVDYLLLKHNFGHQEFPDMCCFNVSYFSHTIDGQINGMHKEITILSNAL